MLTICRTIFLDVDDVPHQDRMRISLMENARPWVAGAKVGDAIEEIGIQRLFMYHIPEGMAFLVDQKDADTPDRAVRRMRKYLAYSPFLPTFMTVSGVSADEKKLESLAAARGKMSIILVPFLSSELMERQLGELLLARRALLAKRCGLQGITCPAPFVRIASAMKIKGELPVEFVIIATGTRSLDVSLHNHAVRVTPEKALRDGATHVVIGREVTKASNPLKVLEELAMRCSAARSAAMI